MCQLIVLLAGADLFEVVSLSSIKPVYSAGGKNTNGQINTTNIRIGDGKMLTFKY